MPQDGRVAEAGSLGDDIHGRVALFQELLGQQDPLAGQPPLRRRTDLLDEPPGEGPGRHRGPAGQVADGDRFLQMPFHPVDDVAQRVGLRLRYRALDILRLAAVAVRRHDHAPRDGVGHLAALFLAHQVEAGVDARGGARACDHRIIVHVQDGRVDPGRRKQPGKVAGLPPVGRAPPPVEQPGCAEYERPGADAEHPRATADAVAQCREQRLGKLAAGASGHVVTHGGHGDQVRFLDPFQAERGLQGESRLRAERSRLAGHYGEVVGRQAVVAPVGSEYLAYHPELERREAVEHQHGHVLEHVTSMLPTWQDVTHICHCCHCHS